MLDTDLGTAQEVGYLTLHVDIPISNAATPVAPVSPGATGPVATTPAPGSSTAASAAVAKDTVTASSAVAAVTTQKEQTVLGALSGDGDFDTALSVVAAQAANYKADLPGLSEFLLARRSGDTEGFKQWTLNARTLGLKAEKDAATGATVLNYRRMVAELRVQIKLGPDYKQVMAGLQNPNSKVFNAALDKVILATNTATNGGIDYGSYTVQVLNHLKATRKTPVAYTQTSKNLGITNSAQ